MPWQDIFAAKWPFIAVQFVALVLVVSFPKGLEAVYERYHYAPGIWAGDTLYISGQVGRDNDLRVVGVA